MPMHKERAETCVGVRNCQCVCVCGVAPNVEERWSAECMGMERREWKRGERACKREGLNYSNEPRMRERGALVLGASKRCV